MKANYFFLMLLFFIPCAVNAQHESQKDETGVYIIVDDMPTYPGGEDALRTFITENVNYPEDAKKNNIQGKVFVSFVVNEKGSVENVKIARSVDPSLDKEALRVVKSLSGWTPGKEKGEAVKVSFTIPIIFALQ